jgi:hypothetical protein
MLDDFAEVDAMDWALSCLSTSGLADRLAASVYGLFPFCKHFITSGLGYDGTRISGL